MAKNELRDSAYTGNISGCASKERSGCATHPCRQAYCGENKSDNVKPLFTLGQVVATPGALQAIEASGDSLFTYLSSHQSGDWGDVDPDDQKEKLLSLEHGFRLMSMFTLSITGGKIWMFINLYFAARRISLHVDEGEMVRCD